MTAGIRRRRNKAPGACPDRGSPDDSGGVTPPCYSSTKAAAFFGKRLLFGSRGISREWANPIFLRGRGKGTA